MFMNKFNLSYLFEFFLPCARYLKLFVSARAPDSKMMTICQSYSCLMACTFLSSEEKLCD